MFKTTIIVFAALGSVGACTQASGPFESSVKHDGVIYELKTRPENLQCPNFSVDVSRTIFTGKAWQLNNSTSHTVTDLQLNELQIGDSIGGVHWIYSQTFDYLAEGTRKPLGSAQSIFPDYEKIDPSRVYSFSAMQCLDNNSVLVLMWGGGNCDTVCEAYGIIKFDAAGEIAKAEGLDFQEYKALKEKSPP